MRLIREMFSESGDISCMRVMSFVALLAAIGLAFTGHDNSVLVFVGAAFGGKIAQKHIELNGVKTDTEVVKDGQAL
jgi:hypothetical protein